MVSLGRWALPLALAGCACLACSLVMLQRDPLSGRTLAPAEAPTGRWEPEPGAGIVADGGSAGAIRRIVFDGERVLVRMGPSGDAPSRILSRGDTGMLVLVRGSAGRETQVSIHWPGRDAPLLVSDGVQRVRFLPAR